jgi:hypothetical protein
MTMKGRHDEITQPGSRLFQHIIIPVPELVNPFFVAGARAIARMPRLRRLQLVLESPLPYTLVYTVLENERRATLLFSGSPPYDPPDKVKEAWREAAKIRNEALVIRFCDEGAIFRGIL